MDDLISRQAAIDGITDIFEEWKALDIEEVTYALQEVSERLQNMLIADLSEYCDKLWETAYERGKAEAHSRTGKWVYDEERGARGIYAICTACNEMIYQTGGFNYCPNCGARMEES